MPTHYNQRDTTPDLLKRVHVPLGWPRRLFAGTLVLFCLTIIIYVGLLFGYKTYLENSLVDTEVELQQLGAQVEPTTQENFINFRSQIENLKTIFNNHVIIADFFPFLESVTHKQTVYYSSEFTKEDMTVKLIGSTESYATLASQLKMYEESPWVTGVTLEHSTITAGLVKFNVKLTISPKVLLLNTADKDTIPNTGETEIKFGS
ncbi:MAG: hypothetical protein V1652_03040 [bacterium]